MKNIMLLIRDDWDRGDPWGSVISAFFSVAETLFRHGTKVPAEWKFSPSPMINVGDSPDEDDDLAVELSEGIANGHYNVDDLLYAGNIFHRYADWCRRDGVDY